MLVTPLGIVTLVKLVQPLKALLPMLVTLFGITVFLHPVIKVFVAVSIIALQLFLESYVLLLLSTVIDTRLSH